MNVNKETLGKLSIILAATGFVVPFVLGLINAVTSPYQPEESPYLGILYIVLNLAAIVCAITSIKTREGRIGLSGAIATLSLLFVMAAFFSYHRYQAPKDQALAFYRALHEQNWKQLWHLTHFTPMEKRVWRTPEIYDRDMRQNLQYPFARQAFAYFAQVQDFTVEEPQFELQRAHVPTSAAIRLNGTVLHLHGSAYMIEEDGTWKVIISDADGDDPYRGYCKFLGIPYHPQPR